MEVLSFNTNNDYTKLMLDSNIHKVDNEQSLGQCYLLQSLLHIEEMFEDTFNVLFDLNGRPLITYTYHQAWFVVLKIVVQRKNDNENNENFFFRKSDFFYI